MASRITRRTALQTAATSTALAALAGGLGPSIARAAQAGTPDAAADASPAASPAAGGFPIEVTTAAGTAVVPAPAERVIALSFPDVDTVVALGVVPVAMQYDCYTETGISAWFDGVIAPEDTALLPFAATTLPLEDLVAARPDLILDTIGFRTADAYSQVAEIAPTVSGLPADTTDALTDRTRLIGRLLGKEAEAEEALATAQTAIDAVPATFPGLDGLTYTYGYVRTANEIGVVTDPANFTTRLFDGWGMGVTPSLTGDDVTSNPGPGGILVSWEQIQLLDADAIFLGFVSPDLQDQFEASPLFSQLEAVKNGHYFPLTQELTVAIQLPSVANLPWVVEQLTPAFTTLTTA